MTSEEMEERLKLLEKRQQATEDIEAIKQLQYRYMNSFMKAEWDEVLKCFAEDCFLDVLPGNDPVTGIEQIEKIFKGILAGTHVGKEGEIVLHPIIHVNGDRAKGNWIMYMLWSHSRTWHPLFWVQGAYDAEYTRLNGQWKFSYLKHRVRFGPSNAVRIKADGYW
jgi:hypothetical protein